MRIGFTGTRKGMTEKQFYTLRLIMGMNRDDIFHHGDCVGADKEAHLIASVKNMKGIVIHPSNLLNTAHCERIHFSRFGAIILHKPKPPLERNKDIVNKCDFLVACPETKNEQLRSGTWSTIRYARKQNKDVTIIYPDGSVGK